MLGLGLGLRPQNVALGLDLERCGLGLALLGFGGCGLVNITGLHRVDRCHTCNFIAQLCRAIKLRDKVARQKIARVTSVLRKKPVATRQPVALAKDNIGCVHKVAQSDPGSYA